MHMGHHSKAHWIVGATVISAIVGLALYEGFKAAFPDLAPANLVAKAKASASPAAA